MYLAIANEEQGSRSMSCSIFFVSVCFVLKKLCSNEAQLHRRQLLSVRQLIWPLPVCVTNKGVVSGGMVDGAVQASCSTAWTGARSLSLDAPQDELA